MCSSQSSTRRSVTTITSPLAGRSLSRAFAITPVWPSPPAVARKRPGVPSGVTSTDPSAVISVNPATCWQNEPAWWWFLPCTSWPMQPPTVAKPVPGITAGSQPFGPKAAAISPTRAPASTSSTPVAGSNASIRSSRVMSMTRPPSFRAASP